MKISDLKKRKIELGYTNEKISELSGVPLSTVQKFFGSTTNAPRYRTIQAITQALFPNGVPGDLGVLDPEIVNLIKKENDAPSHTYLSVSRRPHDNHILEEPSIAYNTSPKSKYTIDDYYALPDDVRVELIDGVFYDMATPTFIHQRVLLKIAFQLEDCVIKHNMPCMVCIAPQDVQLDKDQYTMLQPDVFVVCDRDKIQVRSLYGAPDFAIEILSPSTRWKDLTLKLNKYKKAGVREYWIIDPEDEEVVVYFFEKNDLPHMQEHGKPVPVHISDGKCAIDFTAIWEAVAPLKERS